MYKGKACRSQKKDDDRIQIWAIGKESWCADRDNYQIFSYNIINLLIIYISGPFTGI